MSGSQMVRFVILPHIAKTIYAPLSNFFIWLVLGSSIGGDLRRRGTHRPGDQHLDPEPSHHRDLFGRRRASTSR